MILIAINWGSKRDEVYFLPRWRILTLLFSWVGWTKIGWNWLAQQKPTEPDRPSLVSIGVSSAISPHPLETEGVNSALNFGGSAHSLNYFSLALRAQASYFVPSRPPQSFASHQIPATPLASSTILPVLSPVSDEDPSPKSLDPKPFCDRISMRLSVSLLPLFAVWCCPLPYLNHSHLQLVSHIYTFCLVL